MCSWKTDPTSLHYWPEDIDYIMFIDENGNSNINPIIKKMRRDEIIDINERYFTTTGCVIARDDFPNIRARLLDLKNSYWENGLFYYIKDEKYKRVCFHSTDIRNCRGPFSNEVIDYQSFIGDLTKFIVESNFIIFSSTIDKVKLINNYPQPDHPYNLCLDFILERFGKFYLKNQRKTGLLFLEARGKKEDKHLLKHIVEKLEKGTYYIKSRDLENIRGVYFNTKWCKDNNDQSSYLGLELADLVSFPIHKFWRNGVKDDAFRSIENKLYGYPSQFGRGIKIFP